MQTWLSNIMKNYYLKVGYIWKPPVNLKYKSFSWMQEPSSENPTITMWYVWGVSCDIVEQACNTATGVLNDPHNHKLWYVWGRRGRLDCSFQRVPKRKLHRRNHGSQSVWGIAGSKELSFNKSVARLHNVLTDLKADFFISF